MKTSRDLSSLSTGDLLIAPSVLAADFSRLGADIQAVDQAGAEIIHLDIMDGHFVPNISFGPAIIKSCRPQSQRLFDVHLMITHPATYIEPFAKAGADHITVHVEVDEDLNDTISAIHGLGCTAGITLRPGTPASALEAYISVVDMVLVMTVEPGFGGRSFMHDMIPKIRAIREMIRASGRPVHIEVDGGIDAITAPLVAEAGANILVAGSSVFRAPEGVQEAINCIRRTAIAAHNTKT